MVRRAMSAEYLFHKYDFHAVMENQRARMCAAIDGADAGMIRATEVDALVESFVGQFRLFVPELTEGAISVEVEEAQVDVTGDPMRAYFGNGPHYVPGIRATYHVPYVGDRDIFLCQPSTYTTVIPAAELAPEDLVFVFERPDQDVAATKGEFDGQVALVKQYLGWLQGNATAFHSSLPQEARQRIEARRARLAQVEHGAESLGLPIRRMPGAPLTVSSVRPVPSHRGSRDVARTMPKYDVALSFAGEDRAFVEEVAKGLKESDVDVFYDAFEKVDLWGKNLIDHLADIYQNRSRYVVMFVSAAYVEKAWPTHERRHAQARALLANGEYILPARFDDTEVPGLTNTVGYADLRVTKPDELVKLILSKLGKARR